MAIWPFKMVRPNGHLAKEGLMAIKERKKRKKKLLARDLRNIGNVIYEI
jgi:hypothetical protein